MGGKSSNSQQVTKYTGIEIQTSAQGVVIPICWGKVRIGTNLFWWSNFVAKPVKGGKGGKGGGGKGGASTYTYSAAVMLGLCEGPITGIDQVWTDQDTTTLTKLGLTLFHGTASQAPWSFLTSEHPDQALAYAYTAFLANDSYQLGYSPTLPNHNFEIITPLSGSMPGTVDVNPADFIEDFLTNPQYGIGPITIDSVSLAVFKTYCQAQGLFFSPCVDTAEQVSSILDRWSAITNTWIFWSGSALKFVPLGDSTITANGVTYTPDLTIQYNLSSKDFMGYGKVEPSRADPADCPNHVKLECRDRSNAYNMAPIEWQDQALVDLYGRIDSAITTAHEVCDLSVGNLVAQLVGQRGAFNRNTYAFDLGLEFMLLEPGDLVNIDDPASGIDPPRTVRISRTERDDTDTWSMSAELFLQGIGTAFQGTSDSSDSEQFDSNVDPGDVNFPMIFEPNTALTSGTPQLWLALSGGADYGGTAAFVSFDNVTFSPIGFLTANPWQGTLITALPSHADPDSANTLKVDNTESVGIMDVNATHADADAFRTLALINTTDPVHPLAIPNNGEVVAYGTVAQGIGGPYDFDITYMRRALYGTTLGSHAIGSNFVRFDLNSTEGVGNTVLIYDLPPQYIGQTIYFKFVAFNQFSKGVQDISTLSAYTYVPTGAGYGTQPSGLPKTPTGFAGSPSGNGVAFSWNANTKTDNISAYQVWGAVGTSIAFGSTSLLFSTPSLNCFVANLISNTAYTFYLVATNSVGASSPTAALNITTATVSTNGYRAVTVSSASPFTLANTDAYVDITNTSGFAITIQMPPSPSVGQRIVVNDAGGNAATHNITLKDNTGITTFDVITANNGWTNPRMWTGSAWRITA